MGGWKSVRYSLLLLLSAAMAAWTQSGNLPVKILSYNLHHGEGTDARLDLERIGRIITSINPDYAGLQEIDSVTTRTNRVNQAAEYSRLTGMAHWAFARGIALQGGAYGNAALSKLPILKTARIALPGDEPRAALITDIDLSGGADPSRSTVTFIDTHLMAGGGGAEADRLESAKLINAWVDNPANGNPDRPMILVGDMNAGRGSGSISELMKRWQTTSFNYGIDWVFHRPAERWRVVRTSKLTSGDAAVASDHDPVIQEMELIRPGVTALFPGRGVRVGRFPDLACAVDALGRSSGHGRVPRGPAFPLLSP